MNHEYTTAVLFPKESQVLFFAAQELVKYLGKAGVQAYALWGQGRDPYLKQIFLEVKDSFGVENPEIDDGYEIQINDFQGVICGSNERSVLLGVYRYLRELGFSFLRPGIQGERYPSQLKRHNIRIKETPSYRHRGICIEGAVSYENVLELVDWLPKAGLNTYFTQFLVPYEFFKCWYEHRNNPYAQPEPVPTEEEVDCFVKHTLVPQMKLRGLIWQAAGHGMTTEAIGLSGTGWDSCSQDVVPETCRRYLAEVNGKRELFYGAPLNTNLCYSNPEVRERITDGAIRYLEQNPLVDVLHFWLADDCNNSCECEACRQKLPADWYVEILNLLDQKLTEKGRNTRVVFLSYFDLLWPPVKEKLKNPDRFIFMFAPITRSYRKPFPKDGSSKLPVFERNHLKFPQAVEENFSFLKGWQKGFQGDSFIFEYHYMWNLFRDWGDYASAKVLYQDIRNLKELGLNGYISCQETRAFAPTGLGMWILAETLWKKEADFDQLVDKYFQMSYGMHGEEVLDYVKALSRLSYEEQPEQDGPGIDEAAAGKLLEAAELVKDMRPSLLAWMEEARHSSDRVSYRFLMKSGQAAEYYFSAMYERRMGREEKARERFQVLKEYLGHSEMEWQEGFDVYWFIRRLGPKFE